MAREFFTGGMMPSFDLLPLMTDSLDLVTKWRVSGLHYQATSEAWLRQLDERREEVESILSGAENPAVQIQRWRMFFMACAELFGHENGGQWHVAHYLFEKTA